MTTLNIVTMVSVGVFGLAFCVRPLFLPYFHRAWVALGADLEKAAKRQNALSDFVVDGLISSAKSMSLFSGLLVVYPPSRKGPDTDAEVIEMEKCIERHSWVLPYLWEGNCLMQILFALSKPWDVRQGYCALKAIISLACLRRPEGGISYIGDSTKSAKAFVSLHNAIQSIADAKERTEDRHKPLWA